MPDLHVFGLGLKTLAIYWRSGCTGQSEVCAAVSATNEEEAANADQADSIIRSLESKVWRWRRQMQVL